MSKNEEKATALVKAFTLTPKDGGMVVVSLADGKQSAEAQFPNEVIEREAEKMGLGRPTPQTPRRGDRVTG